MRNLLLAVLFLVFAGCATSLPDLAYENQTNLVRLSVGMKKSQVLDVMGTKSAQTKDGPVANPFRMEMFQDKDGGQYEVLYYVTERNRRGHAVTTSNATPLVLKDGVLLGWGRDTFLRARAASR